MAVVTGGEIRFTSLLKMELQCQVGEIRWFALQLPLFVWLAHGGGELSDVIEPVFYIDDTPDVASPSQAHLLRGASEAACEEAWSIYLDLIHSGLPDRLVRQILPANLMCEGTVVFESDADLMAFVETTRESPIPEIALLARGYRKALTNGD